MHSRYARISGSLPALSWQPPGQTSRHESPQVNDMLRASGKDTETGKNVRILVVEDNAVNRKVAVAHLRRLGYTEIDTAVNGRVAVEMVQEKDGGYSVVFMDIAMPVMDGLEATQCIRRLHGRAKLVPIIALTASVSQRDQDKCFECGMSDFLAKPLRSAELAAKTMCSKSGVLCSDHNKNEPHVQKS